MIRRILPALFALSLLLAGVPSHAGTFNLFSPAAGVLKGNPATYVTTAATAPDVYALWGGTCSNLTYLRGDGTCATPPGTGGGTVNSVALTAPSVFAVAGSPVTSTGTLALTFATGQTQNRVLASPDGSSGAIALRALVAADLPVVPLATGVSGTLAVAHGGTGAVTLTGPLKGNGTSAFTAAVSADIVGLWSGTCNSGTVLKGDGSCGAVGTVTSVALTVPSGFSVTGSPVTTSGTLAITGTLNVAAGGTGAATLTGPIKGNGTSALTAAAAADVYGLWSGLCSSTTFLRGDGSCQTPSGGASGANPSATIGLTAVNGASGNFLRADGAPALSQAIVPTWTGMHTFSSGTSETLIGLQNTTAGSNAKNILLREGSGGQFQVWSATDAAPTVALTSLINSTRTGAAWSNLTLGNATDNPSLVWSGSGTWSVGGGVGTNGQVLTSGGAGVAPAWATVAVPIGANPSASIGLTANNGVATTFMRSDATPALSQAIVPTWTGQHTFSATSTFTQNFGSASGGAIQLQNSSPVITWNETDGAANNKLWPIYLNAEQMNFAVSTDAGALTSYMTVDRTAGVIDIVGLAATTVAVTGAETISGNEVVSGTSEVANNTVRYRFNELDGPTNEKRWELQAAGGGFFGVARNDADNVETTWLDVERTGATVDTISFPNGILQSTATTPSVLATTSGSNVATVAANVSGANEACTIVNNSGSSACGMPAGHSGFSILASPLEFGVAGTVRATVDASGLSSLGSRVCTANGTNCPSGGGTAFGVLSVSGAACTLSGSYDSRNISSCTYSGAGSYIVNFTAGSVVRPACTVTSFNSGTAREWNVSGGTATTISVQGLSLTSASPITWTATDASFAITCLTN